MAAHLARTHPPLHGKGASRFTALLRGCMSHQQNMRPVAPAHAVAQTRHIYRDIAKIVPKQYQELVWKASHEHDNVVMEAISMAAKVEIAENELEVLRRGVALRDQAYEARLLAANSKILEGSHRMSMPGVLDHLVSWAEELLTDNRHPIDKEGLWFDVFTNTGEGRRAFEMIKDKTSIRTEADAARRMVLIHDQLKRAVKAKSLQAFNNGRAGIAIFKGPLSAEDCQLMECLCIIFCFPYQRF